eukprot:3625366-Pyramimonas_sp.AAC.1
MGPAVFLTAVRYRLREVQPVVQAVPICGGCGNAVDQQATHYVCCNGVAGRGWQPPDGLAPRPGVGAGGDAAG